MAVNSSALNVTETDFENIADNLKEFLKGQSTLRIMILKDQLFLYS